jgi:hypothetical protein
VAIRCACADKEGEEGSKLECMSSVRMNLTSNKDRGLEGCGDGSIAVVSSV